jgi:hypothetical protein
MQPAKRRASRFDPNILLVILFSLFAIGPLLQPGYQWDAHDARHSVYFLFEFDRGIQDGIPYPRWQPDFAFGYGYPFFNIYGPLATYVAEAFYLLGAGYTGAVKIVLALSVVASGLAMYGFVKRVLGRRPALVAAVAYMVIPYRLVDIYVRAALAESVAYVFVPLVLWGVWAALHRPRLINIVGLAFAYAALMFTSPLVTLLLTLILVFFIAALALARANDEQPFRQLTRESLLPFLGHLGHLLFPVALGLILGVCLSAVFALPAMTESRFVRVDQWYGGRYAWGSDFVEFFQLFSPRWGFGVSVPGPEDDVSFQLGVVPVVLSLFALLPLFRKKPRAGLDRPAVRLILFFAGLTAVVVFLMLGVSALLWEVLPLARLAQFPWRLLTFSVISMAFLCGAAAINTRPAKGLVDLPTLILVILLILGSLPYMVAEMSEQEVSIANLMRFQQSADEMTGSTAWVRTIPTWSSMADYHIAGKPVTSKVNYGLLYAQPGEPNARTLELGVNHELVEYLAKESIAITFDTFYYPGWHAYLLDPETNEAIEELPIATRGELGLMTVQVPAGLGRVLLQFEDTPVRKLGTALTFGSLGIVLVTMLAAAALKRRWPRQRQEELL